MYRGKATILFLLLIGLAIGPLRAQVNQCIPTTCFEIESILVDACGLGTQEGLNEMVIFHVGPTPLNTATMTAAWPNTTNTWTGICQNATTAGKVAAINATITSCGRLVEPVGGILPAGKRVILFTSQSVDQTLHSFANLNDTLIAIFHCGSNLSGNFANTGTGTRTLTMGFGGPCTDAVTYDRALLGGNGSIAYFCWNGSATYFTPPSCTAPYYQLSTTSGTAQTVCIGTPVTVSGTVSSCVHCYGWYGGTGTFSNPNALSTTYTPGPGETGVVNLMLGQFTSCDTAFSTVPITYAQPPVFSLGADTAFCGSFSLQLGPGITGQSYAWSNGPTTQNITVTSPGTYALTLTSTAGCVVSDTITIGTSTMSSLGFPPDDTICVGGNFFLFPSVLGMNYAWSTGSNATGINITTPGTYSLTLTTPTGCVGMDTFQLYNYPATTVNLGGDTTLCPGNTVLLDADPLGNFPGATYQWSTNATTQSITVSTQGTYSVTITTTNFCTAIDTILVNFNSNVPVNLGPDDTLCVGDSLILDAGSGLSYAWSTGANSQTITVNATNTYAVTVTFGVGCQTADTMALTVNPNPTVNLGNDTLYCANLGLTLDAGPGNSYLWNTTATTQTLPITAGGTYSVIVTNAFNCSAYDTILVSQGLVPQVNLGPNTTLCNGQTLTLDAGTQATTYLWSTNETTQTISVTTPGTYWVVVTTNCGTDSSATIVDFIPPAAVDAGPDDTLCAGDTLTFLGSQATAGTLLWSGGGGSVLNDPNTLHPLFTADSNASGPVQFVLTLTDTCGTYTDTMMLEIIPRISLTFAHVDSVCYGLPIQIGYTGNADSVHWMGLGTFNPPTGSPTVYTPAGGEVGYIDLTAVAYGQCGTDTFVITYFGQDTVIANFSWTPGLVYPGTYVQFQNAVIPFGLPVHWAFGDSFFSVDNEPIHRFYTDGTYQVELIAYGVDGCNDTLEIPLVVSPVDTIIPNVFSPNGDGVNDFFDIFNQKEPPTEWFNLVIFDRWGEPIFTTVNPLERWDGTKGNGGSPVPDGVYYYVIKMKFLKGRVINYAGPVTVLR